MKVQVRKPRSASYDWPNIMLWAGEGEDVLGAIRLMYAENSVFRAFLLLLLYSSNIQSINVVAE